MVVHRVVSDQNIASTRQQIKIGATTTTFKQDSENNASTNPFIVDGNTPDVYFYFPLDTDETDAEKWVMELILAVGGGSIPNGIKTYPTLQGTGVKFKDFFESNYLEWQTQGTEERGRMRGSQWTDGYGGNWEGVIYGWATEETIAT